MQAVNNGILNNEKKIEKPPVKKPVPPRSRAEDIDQVYGESELNNETNEFKKINRPAKRNGSNKLWRNIISVLAACFLLFWAYHFFTGTGKKSGDSETANQTTSGWYAVKLVNNEIY